MKTLSSCSPGPVKYINIFFLSAVFIYAIPCDLFSQQSQVQKHTFHFEWGNNIWGNSISLGYDYGFTKKNYAGISLGSGFLKYSFDENGNAFFFSGAPGEKNSFTMDFKQTIDIRIGFFFKQPGGLSLFNRFETGLSCNHFILTDEYVDANSSVWKGSMEFVMYGLILNMEFLDYRPIAEKHLDFSFGFKSKFTVTGSQEMRYESPGYLPKFIPFEQNGNRDMLFWAYPEFYLRINYIL